MLKVLIKILITFDVDNEDGNLIDLFKLVFNTCPKSQMLNF